MEFRRWDFFQILEGKQLFKTIADSFTVTRVAPRFDVEGNHTGSDFWLHWKSVGYNNGFQYSHTIKVVKIEDEDILTDDYKGEKRSSWCVVKLIDDCNRIHRVELIEPFQEPNEAATACRDVHGAGRDWKKWLTYKESRSPCCRCFGEIEEVRT